MNINKLDKFIASVAPKYGANRIETKMRIGAAINNYGTIGGGGYDTAGSKKRFLNKAASSANSHNYDFINKRQNMIGLSRDVATNTPLAKSALNRKTTNIIGSGLRLNVTPDYEILSLTDETAAQWALNVEKLFNNYALSNDCDITRTSNFYELQYLAQYSIFLSGDVVLTFPYKEVKTLTVGTRIKLIESDLLKTPPRLLSDSSCVAGIETDAHGAPTVYHFSNRYLQGNYNLYNTEKFTQINAFNKNDERDVYHLFYKMRPSQTRGVMLLAECINLLKQVTKLGEAELTAHVVSSFFTVFIKDTEGFNEGLENVPTVAETGVENGFNIDREKIDNSYDLGSGNVIELDNNKDIEIAESRVVPEGFESFNNSFLKQLGAAIDIPLSQLLLSFNQSYSGARGELLEAYKAVRKDRAWFANNFCKPVFEKWLDEMVATGQIIATGYFEDLNKRAAWRKCVWTGVGMGQIDPLKETKAAVMKIDSTLSNESIEYNNIHDSGDYQSNIKTLAFNKQARKNLGLVMNTSTDTTPENIEEKEELEDE